MINYDYSNGMWQVIRNDDARAMLISTESRQEALHIFRQCCLVHREMLIEKMRHRYANTHFL